MVPGATLKRLIRLGDTRLEEAFLDAAWSLVREGAWAITGSCGFMILFQEALARVLPVPVFLSSLLQIPWILPLIGPSKVVGVITADGASLRDEHLRLAGVEDLARVRVVGMEDAEAFCRAVLREEGPLERHLVEQEVKERALRLAKGTPELGAVLLECTNLGPYASTIRDALRLPVFDINTLIHLVFRAVRPPRFRVPFP
jgi:hypothetical protein